MVKGQDKKGKRIIKLKNKTMPKFTKNTGYQMPHGNSPHKFIGGVFRNIFGGRSSKPKTPTSGNLASFAQRPAVGNTGFGMLGLGNTGNRNMLPNFTAGQLTNMGMPGRKTKSTGGGGMFGNTGLVGGGLAGAAIPAWMRSRRDRAAAMGI
jgi:hypothetical protein